MSVLPFEEQLGAEKCRNIRILCIVSVLGWLSFIGLDLLVVPQAVSFTASVRILFGGLVVGLYLATRWWAGAPRYADGLALAWLFMSLAVSLLLTIDAYPPTGNQFAVSLMLVVVFLGAFMPWSLKWSLAGLLVTIGCYLLRVAVGMWVGEISTGLSTVLEVVNFTLFIGAGGFIGAWSSNANRRWRKEEFQLQQALRDRSARLEQLDRLKSRFFANISHELRTPLTLILAPLGDLLTQTDDPDDRHQLEVIQNNAGRLLRLIDELLDLSRLDAGGLRLNIADVDLSAIAASVFESVHPAAVNKGIHFQLDVCESTPGLYGDGYRLETVVMNLVGNALKYVPKEGHVEVKVWQENGFVLFQVADDGPGIPPEDLDRIFERFFRVGATGAQRRRDEGGVGIGLSLAKELVELHDGRIWVESELGEGTLFTVKLQNGRDHFRPEVIERRKTFRPAHQGRRQEDRAVAGTTDLVPTAPRAPRLLEADETPLPMLEDRNARILVVEDKEELRSFLVRLLERSYQVLAAVDGQEGLELVKSKRPDMVLSDVMMPRLSGTELCKAIKSDPRLRHTPVILLTARVGSEATLEAYAYGADDFVAKPFHPRVLLARVRAQLRLQFLSLRLVAQEKLASVGTLAAGLAHEVKNPINAILHAARALQKQPERPADTLAMMYRVIANGAERILAIVTALEEHTRPAEAGGANLVETPDAGLTERADAAEGVRLTLELLSARLDMVTVHQQISEPIWVAMAPGPLNQVLLNLLDNALRAGASTLWVQAEREDGRVRISVLDDGPGVPQGTAHQVFDPFFTTREPGEGTGLGLYLSRQLVLQRGGELRLASESDGGARFDMILPAEAAG